MSDDAIQSENERSDLRDRVDWATWLAVQRGDYA